MRLGSWGRARERATRSVCAAGRPSVASFNRPWRRQRWGTKNRQRTPVCLSIPHACSLGTFAPISAASLSRTATQLVAETASLFARSSPDPYPVPVEPAPVHHRLQQGRRPLGLLPPASHDHDPTLAKVLEVDLGLLRLDVAEQAPPHQDILPPVTGEGGAGDRGAGGRVGRS